MVGDSARELGSLSGLEMSQLSHKPGTIEA